MGARGPQPKPTALAKLQGNPGKRPLPKNEPQPKRVLPRVPSHLSDEGKKEWRRISRKLYDLGVLTEVDLDALASYCEHWATWKQATAMMRQEGLVVETPNGYLQPSPWINIADKAFKNVLALLREFGMTPSSRTRVKVEKSEGPSEFEQFLARKTG